MDGERPLPEFAEKKSARWRTIGWPDRIHDVLLVALYKRHFEQRIDGRQETSRGRAVPGLVRGYGDFTRVIGTPDQNVDRQVFAWWVGVVIV